MDIIDFFITNFKTFFGRFLKIESSYQQIDEDDEFNRENNFYLFKVYEYTNILNHLEFHIPMIEDISVDEFKMLFMLKGLSTGIIYTLSSRFDWFLFLLRYDMMYNGMLVSMATLPYMLNAFDHLTDQKSNIEIMEKEEKEYLESFEYKYDDFLLSQIEEMSDLYKNMNDNCLDPEYTMEDRNDLEQLKEKSQHMTIDLPFEKNTKLIMYYDREEEAFVYYTERGDVLYNVLNACCRQYVMEKKCVNLFKDEDDIDFFTNKEEQDETEDKVDETEEKETKPRQSRSASDQDIADNYEVLEGKGDEEEDKKEEPKSLFKTKKTKEDKTKEEKKEEQEKNQKGINKFIHRGNLEEYKEATREKKEAKKVDYNAFKNFWGGGANKQE